MFLLWKATKFLIISIQVLTAFSLPSILIELTLAEGLNNLFQFCLLGMVLCAWFLLCIWVGIHINKDLNVRLLRLFNKDN